MSDHGIIVYNEYGQTRLAVTDRTFRLVAVFQVGLAATGSFNIPGLSSRSPYAFATPINPGFPVNFSILWPHFVYISGDNVHYMNAFYYSGPSIIYVYATA